ncbi:MAG: hypothetical protein M3497_03990, partial [Gemmatimonadota bacterium]|nr:hypothetical protein [Gemmatimonadota bacterium]
RQLRPVPAAPIYKTIRIIQKEAFGWVIVEALDAAHDSSSGNVQPRIGRIIRQEQLSTITTPKFNYGTDPVLLDERIYDFGLEGSEFTMRPGSRVAASSISGLPIPGFRECYLPKPPDSAFCQGSEDRNARNDLFNLRLRHYVPWSTCSAIDLNTRTY